MLIDGTAGNTALILKSSIEGATFKTKLGFVYVGAEELTLIAPVSKLGDPGATGNVTSDQSVTLLVANFVNS